jgi:hypothetical protein
MTEECPNGTVELPTINFTPQKLRYFEVVVGVLQRH